MKSLPFVSRVAVVAAIAVGMARAEGSDLRQVTVDAAITGNLRPFNAPGPSLDFGNSHLRQNGTYLSHRGLDAHG
jgi:hypothetical protein